MSLILDTAGRLHVDEEMMEELQNIKEAVYRTPDDPGCGFHDRSGCSKCSYRLLMKNLP